MFLICSDHLIPMDDVFHSVLHGCELVKNLELALQSVDNIDPRQLQDSCERVATAFYAAATRLKLMLECSGGEQIPAMEGVGSMGFFAPLAQVNVLEMGGAVSVGGGGAEVRSSEASGSERKVVTAGSSGQRASRKRKEEGGSGQTIRVPVPRPWNPEIPPDDGHTWRKYGQKPILGATFPRSYYRCTHKDYGCKAKKQVQRVDHDPYTYEVFYSGQHTCQTSISPFLLPNITSIQPPTVPVHAAGWPGNTQGGETSSLAGTSRARCSREMDSPMEHFANVIFNVDADGGSMDAIFSFKRNKDGS